MKTYGEDWREQRKLVSFGLSNSMLPSYHRLQEQEATRLVCSLLENPDDLFPQTKLQVFLLVVNLFDIYHRAGG